MNSCLSLYKCDTWPPRLPATAVILVAPVITLCPKADDEKSRRNSSAGKAFDIRIVGSISLSVVAVMADSVAATSERWSPELCLVEWGFTILFTAEYALRLAGADRPGAYARSFYGPVDLLANLPSCVSPFVPVSRYLLVIRLLREGRTQQGGEVLQTLRGRPRNG